MWYKTIFILARQQQIQQVKISKIKFNKNLINFALLPHILLQISFGIRSKFQQQQLLTKKEGVHFYKSLIKYINLFIIFY